MHHLSYASADGHALTDRRLHRGWAADDEGRTPTGLPDETVFATKLQPAGDMLEAAHTSGVRAAWVAADEVYGGGLSAAGRAATQSRTVSRMTAAPADKARRRSARFGCPSGSM
ncbi:transposase [Streptomyces sp. NPDC087263]|uniref:transposase n=1 Tax=Streptomyces sp. NPDC087263 TaxID=3365773 RepID=UPI003801F6E1